MKIYHTETQADYDALMAELEAQGFMWSFGRKLSESNNWHVSEHLTCTRVYDSEVDYASLNYYKEEYPHIPITKYKAKADEKMRFNKQNVEREFDKFMQGSDSVADLKERIINLVDGPEKVVVPKFVADYLEDCKKRNIKLVSALCPFKMGYGKEIELWFDNEDNNRLFALAWSNGYEVEKEPLYCVNINGQYLAKMIPERNVHKFVEEVKLCVWDTQAYQLTEAEIKEIDERYWPFAVPAND